MKIKRFLIAVLAGLNILAASSAVMMPVFAENESSSGTSESSSETSGSSSGTSGGSDTIQSDACKNLKEGSIAYKSNGCGGGNTDELPTVIKNILNSVIAISGLVAVAFVIVGGIQYMTSAGDPGKAKRAKDTILYACVGLVICALAFIIVNWTIDIINSAT